MQKSPSPQTEYMDVDSPWSYLRSGAPADTFRLLRAAVIHAAGFDFLAKCADMIRGRNFKSNKPGVAKRSRHQCGDAFDYNIGSPSIVVVREDADGRTCFRTYLKTARQDGSMGTKRTLTDYAGRNVTAYVVDFTELAGLFGWRRIPAHNGWTTKGPNFTKMEFWHYENTERKTWAAAVAVLYPE
jgi:hypothetical protein